MFDFDYADLFALDQREFWAEACNAGDAIEPATPADDDGEEIPF